MRPKVYVIEKTGVEAWGKENAFHLTFRETSDFVHDLQNAMKDQQALSGRTGYVFYILVIPKKE